MTSQENLLLQQKLKEMQLAQAQPPRKQGFLDIIKEGALHGVGWAFAQRMVDSIFGPRTLNISDFTKSGTDVDSGSSSMMSDSSSESPFAEDNDQDQGWNWGSDLFSEDE
ncbi:uncharacterized protein BcabD6B2_16070 [Babesia caballi]|uniref:Uncharacterized protein n=1 Tax=Babesia caballi TaxID=5871 RepID=A0AAV4LRE2_BABCB|nr:hypothetical protein, conserved [Babesia caballi]